MSDLNNLLGSVSLFAGNFAPDGYLDCNGQPLQINTNAALYSILGTKFGGDGRTVFNLPRLTAPAKMRYIICVQGLYPQRS
jgi:microcystin-dependent protein